eukprot:gene7613-biopygen14266
MLSKDVPSFALIQLSTGCGGTRNAFHRRPLNDASHQLECVAPAGGTRNMPFTVRWDVFSKKMSSYSGDGCRPSVEGISEGQRPKSPSLR